MSTSLSLYRFRLTDTSLLAVITLLWVLVRVITGFSGIYEEDSHAYIQLTEAIVAYFKTGFPVPQNGWPAGYPLVGSFLAVLGVPVSWSLQLVSLVSWLALGGYMSWNAGVVHHDISAARRVSFSVLILLTPFIAQYSMRCMAEMLSMLCVAGAFFHTTAYAQGRRGPHIIFAGIWMVFGWYTKYAVLPLWLPLLPWMGVHSWKRKEFIWPLIAFVISAGIYFVIYWITGYSISVATANSWFQGWSFENFVRAIHITPDGVQPNPLPNVLHIFFLLIHPYFYLWALPALWLVRKVELKHAVWHLAGLVLYLFFIAGIPTQNLRYLLPAAPTLGLILIPALERGFFVFLKWHWRAKLIFALMAALLFSLTLYSSRPGLLREQLEQDAVAALRKYPVHTIYTTKLNHALVTAHLPHSIEDIGRKEYTWFAPRTYLLMNPRIISLQQTNHFLITNWERLRAEYTLTVLDSLPLGWKLYLIE